MPRPHQQDKLPTISSISEFIIFLAASYAGAQWWRRCRCCCCCWWWWWWWWWWHTSPPIDPVPDSRFWTHASNIAATCAWSVEPKAYRKTSTRCGSVFLESLHSRQFHGQPLDTLVSSAHMLRFLPPLGVNVKQRWSHDASLYNTMVGLQVELNWTLWGANTLITINYHEKIKSIITMRF